MALAACAPSNSPEPLARNLPPWPGALGAPVAVREPQAGENAIAVAARERAGRIEANGRMAGLRAWYAGVRKDYGGRK
jgi:hypothetical protein